MWWNLTTSVSMILPLNTKEKNIENCLIVKEVKTAIVRYADPAGVPS